MMLLDTSIMEILIDTDILLGIALVLVGIFLSVIATPVSKLLRGGESPSGDKIVLFLKLVALIIIIIALILIPLSVRPN